MPKSRQTGTAGDFSRITQMWTLRSCKRRLISTYVWAAGLSSFAYFCNLYNGNFVHTYRVRIRGWQRERDVYILKQIWIKDTVFQDIHMFCRILSVSPDVWICRELLSNSVLVNFSEFNTVKFLESLILASFPGACMVL